MDNATFHKGKEMQETLEQEGHQLEYLPPYSPDLNPIEKKWAHAKFLKQKFQCSTYDLFAYCNL